jgi:hypothetical protein
VGEAYPTAHEAQALINHISEGTTVAAECCYGAELYDPQLAGGVAGIANAYLGEGAYAYVGSTTIAYGPADANANADLLTRYFVRDVLAGASSGRSLLQARQAFVRDASIVDPADLKTLAQFLLLGDPSIAPVDVAVDDRDPSLGAATPKGPLGASRTARRRNLFANGLALSEATAVARASVGNPSDDLVARLRSLAEIPDSDLITTGSFVVSTPPIVTGMKAFGLRRVTGPSDVVVHVLLGRKDVPGSPRPTVSSIASTFAVIAREEDGELLSWRRIEAR